MGIEKDHGELTMYPLRSDEDGYFEKFMNTLTRMIDEIVPKPTQQAWARNDPDDDQNWLVVDMSRKMGNQSKHVNGKLCI